MCGTEKYGYYHATNEGGFISWYDFACEIFKTAGKDMKVIPVTTAEYGASKAKRPFNSRLDKSKLVNNGFEPLPHWKDALERYLKEIGEYLRTEREKNGVSKQIREFVVPLCATIHLSGSIISIVSFSVSVLMMNGMDSGINIVLPYIMMLGIAMVAAPGAPGGAVMSALSFFPMVGIPADGGLSSLIIALHITQDSFGTAANISGDNAIAVAIDALNNKWNKKEEKLRKNKTA
jgi:hypothetical protein